MIGDDIRDDIGGALKAGLSAILVRTGKYKTGDEGKIEAQPTFIASNIVEAIEYILEDVWSVGWGWGKDGYTPSVFVSVQKRSVLFSHRESVSRGKCQEGKGWEREPAWNAPIKKWFFD